jgi:3-hydroxybutyryl-CoA dehydratase
VKVGDCADVSRTFTARDLQDYIDISGHAANTESVPEPLIGALFSYLLGVKLPGMGTMYLKQETSFLSNAAIGESLTATVEITRLRPEKQLADLSTTCCQADGTLVATGRALVYTGELILSTDPYD